MGSLSVLNTGTGDLNFNFDVDDQSQVEKAKIVIQDMLSRGYALMVEVDGEFHRIQTFDPVRGTYRIVMVPHKARRESEAIVAGTLLAETFEAVAGAAPPKKRGKYRSKDIPMEKARAVGVGPTAGG